MLLRMLLALTLLAPVSLSASENDSEANKSWIAIGPYNLIFAKDNIETQKLIDNSEEMLLMVSGRECQLSSRRIDGETIVLLECEDVTVITSEDDSLFGQTIVTAEQLKYDSSKQVLDLSGGVQIQKQNDRIVCESVQLKLSLNKLQIEASGAKVQLESNWSKPPAIETADQSSALFFNARWCGPCQKMRPIIQKLESVGYPIEIIDVDHSRELVQQYGITSIPQLVVLDGTVVRNRLLGIHSESRVKSVLEDLPSLPAPPPLPEPAEPCGTSAMKPAAIEFTTPHLPSLNLHPPTDLTPIVQTSSENIAQEICPAGCTKSYQPATSCECCPACQSRVIESSPGYQPLIPELFNFVAPKYQKQGLYLGITR